MLCLEIYEPFWEDGFFDATKEVETIETNVIYNEDGIAGMQRLPDKSIDMILCDPPYGTTHNRWDSVLPLDEMWTQYERVIKDNGAIVLFSQQPFTSTLVASNLKLFRYEWIWKKPTVTGFLNANRMPLRAHENILVFYKYLPIYHPQKWQSTPYIRKAHTSQDTDNYGDYNPSTTVCNDGMRYPVDVVEVSCPRGKNSGHHPTQKPVKLLEYLINTYTDSGDIILDNCIGSGSTAVACINTGRNYIGFETDPTYYQTALQRTKAAGEVIT